MVQGGIKMTDTDKLFMEELKQEFMESVTANLEEMTTLYKNKKYEEIAKIAHDIKGTSGIFGLDEGTDIAKELQYAAQDKEDEKTKSLIEQLTRYMKENGIVS
jgi:HPt (histidine-containing phosphotransfer) domain-containing protein